MNRYEQELLKIIQVIQYSHGCYTPSLWVLERQMRRLQEELTQIVGDCGHPESRRAREVFRAFRLLCLHYIPKYQHPSLPVRRESNIERAFEILGLRTMDFAAVPDRMDPEDNLRQQLDYSLSHSVRLRCASLLSKPASRPMHTNVFNPMRPIEELTKAPSMAPIDISTPIPIYIGEPLGLFQPSFPPKRPRLLLTDPEFMSVVSSQLKEINELAEHENRQLQRSMLPPPTPKAPHTPPPIMHYYLKYN